MKVLTTFAFFMALAAGVPALVARAPAVPEPAPLGKRAVICGADDTVETEQFSVVNFHSGTLGSQCLNVVGLFSAALVWSTTWSWDGDASVRKSFVAAQLRRPSFTPISSIQSIPTSWKWSYDVSDDVVANVAYDIHGTSVCGSTMDWNIQVWLGQYGGVTPVGNLLATATVDGVDFDIYTGTQGGLRKTTFMAQTTQQDFTGDLRHYIQWAVDNTNADISWCVYSIQAGTEAYKGTSGVFSATSFKLRKNATPPTTPAPTTTRAPPAPTATGTCAPRWGQCGGVGYLGATCCAAGSFCAFWNDWESQCLPL